MFPYKVEEARRQESVLRADLGFSLVSHPLDIPAIPSSGVSVFNGFKKTHGSKLREHLEALIRDERDPVQEHLATFRRIFS